MLSPTGKVFCAWCASDSLFDPEGCKAYASKCTCDQCLKNAAPMEETSECKGCREDENVLLLSLPHFKEKSQDYSERVLKSSILMTFFYTLGRVASPSSCPSSEKKAQAAYPSEMITCIRRLGAGMTGLALLCYLDFMPDLRFVSKTVSTHTSQQFGTNRKPTRSEIKQMEKEVRDGQLVNEVVFNQYSPNLNLTYGSWFCNPCQFHYLITNQSTKPLESEFCFFVFSEVGTGTLTSYLDVLKKDAIAELSDGLTRVEKKRPYRSVMNSVSGLASRRQKDLPADYLDKLRSVFFQCLAGYGAVYAQTRKQLTDAKPDNIVYSETSEPFLFYSINNQLYKVPTFGKLIKIIDIDLQDHEVAAIRYLDYYPSVANYVRVVEEINNNLDGDDSPNPEPLFSLEDWKKKGTGLTASIQRIFGTYQVSPADEVGSRVVYSPFAKRI